MLAPKTLKHYRILKGKSENYLALLNPTPKSRYPSRTFTVYTKQTNKQKQKIKAPISLYKTRQWPHFYALLFRSFNGTAEKPFNKRYPTIFSKDAQYSVIWTHQQGANQFLYWRTIRMFSVFHHHIQPSRVNPCTCVHALASLFQNSRAWGNLYTEALLGGKPQFIKGEGREEQSPEQGKPRPGVMWQSQPSPQRGSISRWDFSTQAVQTHQASGYPMWWRTKDLVCVKCIKVCSMVPGCVTWSLWAAKKGGR